MPIVKRSNLPTYDRLIREGRPVLPPDRAQHQDIRELHIGFLNIMPDAALEATERQWFRLIGESNRVAQVYIHPFTVPVFERGAEAKKHIDQFYDDFEDLKKCGLDALIVTGTNNKDSTNVHTSDAWAPLRDVLDWAQDNVASTIYSCFASHVLMTCSHAQTACRQDSKKWGIYSHRVLDRGHRLIRGMNTKFDLPHSRYNDISYQQFQEAQMRVLVDSEEAGVHMAVSKDGFRQICLQGHPEYDTASLLKEYKREVENYKNKQSPDYPHFPKNYFGPKAQEILNDLKNKIMNGENAPFPEAEITAFIENTWADSARSFIAGWIGHVYQVTNVDRTKQFMDGIDPNNPLGM